MVRRRLLFHPLCRLLPRARSDRRVECAIRAIAHSEGLRRGGLLIALIDVALWKGFRGALRTRERALWEESGYGRD